MQKVRYLIQTRKPGVDELDIKLAEEKIGAIFPEQYKELFNEYALSLEEFIIKVSEENDEFDDE